MPARTGDGAALQRENIWFAYLNTHKMRATRVLHYIATGLLSLAVIISILTKFFWLTFIAVCLWGAIIAFSHSCLESSQGFFLRHPVLSLMYCFRMSFSALTGHITEDLSDARGNTAKRPGFLPTKPPENW